MLSSALHNHKKVCLGFITKKPAAGSDSKPSSGGGGDGSHGGSTRATPKKDSKAPATNSQGSSAHPASQMAPHRSGREMSHHHKSHKDSKKDPSGRRRMQALPGRAPAIRRTRTAAGVRPESSPALLFHQHPCIFSINYFVVKLMCLL